MKEKINIEKNGGRESKLLTAVFLFPMLFVIDFFSYSGGICGELRRISF